MGINEIIQIINGVGFPIAACIGMAGFIVWDKKTAREYRKETQEKQDEILTQLKTSVDSNTRMVERLLDSMEVRK